MKDYKPSEVWKRNLTPLSLEELTNFPISKDTERFLTTYGLPSKELFDFNFYTSKKFKILKFKNEDYLIIGKDFYDSLIGINLKSDAIFCLDLEDERLVFINSDITCFMHFLDLSQQNEYVQKYNEDEDDEYDEYDEYDEKLASKSVKELKSKFMAIDAESLKDEEDWWPTFLENWETFDEE